MTPGKILRRLRPTRARLVAVASFPLRFGRIGTGWRTLHHAGAGPTRRRVDAVRLWPGGRRLIVKCFNDPGEAERVYRRQRDAAASLPNTVAPLHLSGAGRFMVLPRAAGAPVLSTLRRIPFETSFRGPVTWLRDLHARPVPVAGSWQLADEFVALLERPVVRETGWLRASVLDWRDRARQIRPLPLSVVHGDFHPGNILVEGPEFTIIDFDTVDGIGGAELDLAQLLTHLHMHVAAAGGGAGADRWPGWRDLILEWYGKPALLDDPALACAVQFRRLCAAQIATTSPDRRKWAPRLQLLTRKLSQTRPREILEL